MAGIWQEDGSFPAFFYFTINTTKGVIVLINEQMFKIMEQMVTKNPQFQRFAQQNSGKSMEEVCQKYGIDPNLVRNIIGGATNKT